MWDYNKKVMDHFLNPRNVGEIEEPDAVGEVGNVSCGDSLRLTLKLDEKGKIINAKFKTFGCASAIASSSALTEMIKGKTLDEAAKITNKEIVDLLGELPEEKMHCSVMGMEALQAAIANYRGEPPPTETEEDHEGRIICHCFNVTDTKIRRLAKENNLHTVDEITNYCKACGGCGSCREDIEELLEGLWREEAKKNQEEKPEAPPQQLSTVQKVLKVQEVIDTEVKPQLEKDGGSIELIDINGNTVLVRLKGRCAVCPTSKVTLRNLVEGKLKEFVSPDLIVEEAK